jgi:hypothetical protein
MIFKGKERERRKIRKGYDYEMRLKLYSVARG